MPIDAKAVRSAQRDGLGEDDDTVVGEECSGEWRSTAASGNGSS
jgi:hypothetical protein